MYINWCKKLIDKYFGNWYRCSMPRKLKIEYERTKNIMIEEHVHFNSDGLKLEGLLCFDENTVSPPLVLLCPPHPHLGGDM